MLDQLRDLEQDLENERRDKSGAISQKKKMEAHIAEIEQQLDVANRLKVGYSNSFSPKRDLTFSFLNGRAI